MEKLGDRLKIIRGKISRADFAASLTVHQNTYRNYEKGDRSPDADFLERVCLVYDISPVWLILGSGPMHPNIVEASGSSQATSSATGNASIVHSAGSTLPTPSHAAASTAGINVHEGMMITSKVLSSHTGYANALWENLKSFEAAVEKEARVKELEYKMDLMLEKMTQMEERLADKQVPEKKSLAS